ncbi:MraY family glycosyltransferase [Granulosicoccus sp. 3-233]|uniref:MraY family glycosyltransferase n=1 Tax=Granulosicoccus sp. 3-233 TaxID=3417969 RepID=UPI003D345F5B
MLIVAFTTVFCVAVIPFLGRLAIEHGLTDKPDSRKRHVGEVPLVGGIAIFLTLAVGEVLTQGQLMPPLLLALCLLLVVLGVVDDLKDLSARCRLCFQIAVALLMVVLGDVRIESVGAVLGGTDVEFGYVASVLFTVVCTVGVINAINMIDGLDGLSGSLLSMTLSSMGVLALVHGDTSTALTLFVVTGSLLAFLFYNSRVVRRKAAVFMGDSGSMMLGLILVWYLVEMTQGSARSLSPVAAGWMFGLPLMDTVVVMMGRVLEKRSPFQAGRDHLHHRLRNRQLTVNSTVLAMLAMHSALVLVGTINGSNADNETWLFWAFVALVLVHFVIGKRYFKAATGGVLEAD